MNLSKNENSQIEKPACNDAADLEAVIAEFDEMFGGTDTDDSENSARDRTSVDDELAPAASDEECRRTVRINFPREASACYGIAGIEVTARDFLTWCAAANPESADKLIAIRDGFYSDRDEDFVEPDLFDDTWGPHGPEERALARVTHAKGEAERLARRTAIEAEFDRDDAEAARKGAEEANKWTPFVEERAKLITEEEAHFDRAEELGRKWERFVIESEAWNGDRAFREEARRAELTEEGDALIADQEAWWDRWAGLVTKVEETWARRQPK